MRAIRDLKDAENVLRELTAWKDQITTKGLDLKGQRIRNAGAATEKGDYVRFDQLPSLLQQKQTPVDQYYTAIWSTQSAPTVDEVIESFIVGRGREAVPTQLWLMCRSAPSGGPLSINITFRTVDVANNDVLTSLLDTPLEFPSGGTRKVYTSTFTTNVPKLSNLAEIYPEIVENNGAAVVSIGLVCKLI